MKLDFIMVDTEVSIIYSKKQYSAFIPSSIIMKGYSDYYKPIATYGPKRKRSRKESK